MHPGGEFKVSGESQLVSVFCDVESASILFNYKRHIKNMADCPPGDVHAECVKVNNLL